MSSGNALTRAIVLASTLVVIVALIVGLAGGVFIFQNRPQPVRGNLAESAAGGAPSTSPSGAGAAPSALPAGSGVVPSALPSSAPQTGQCPAPGGFTATSVRIRLARTFTPGPVVSFGLPLPTGTRTEASALRVSANGTPVAATTRALLAHYGPDGAPQGPRSILIQLPTSVLQGDCTEVEVTWQGCQPTASGPGPSPAPYSAVAAPSDEVVDTAIRSITAQGGKPTLVETKREKRVLFSAREPAVLATYPSGYLASTGILGHIVANEQIGPDLAGPKFLADQAAPFGLSAMYQESYALNPTAVFGPNDTDEKAGIKGYEGWLYDRCNTFLLFAATTGDTRFLREGYRVCSFYASKIELNGDNRGLTTITPDPDDKFSRQRGLYAYYALTGDESALEASKAITDLWMNDPYVATPYRAGQLRGPDKPWTERQIAAAIEGVHYGHLVTGDVAYLRATQELIATAYRHVAGDAATLAAINPGSDQFPPQNCLIHNAEQASEGYPDQPWCSGRMPSLMIEALLAYQDQTNGPRIDEIFIRLTRFLRDTGTAYFASDILMDDFMHPSVAYDPGKDLEERRFLIPLYGSGIDANGKRQNYGDYDDTQHCPDATALVALGLRGLRRTAAYDQNPIGPFRSEGESFPALHNELAFCSYAMLIGQTRPNNDPAAFTPEILENGLRDPAKFVEENEIGFPSHNTAYPQRKIGWWFNPTLSQFALLREAGISATELKPGIIQPGGTPKKP